MDGRAKACEIYPPKLVKALLREAEASIRKQWDKELNKDKESVCKFHEYLVELDMLRKE